MKKKEKEQLRSLSVDELNKELVGMVRQESKGNRNTRQARELRRKRAMILTFLRQKELQNG